MCRPTDAPPYDLPITPAQRDALRAYLRVDAMIPLLVTEFIRQEWSIAVFEARDDDGCPIEVAVDARYAAAIIAELEHAPAVPVSVEPHQILGGIG